MKILRLTGILSMSLGQRLESLDKNCGEGFVCRSKLSCPSFKERDELRPTGDVQFELSSTLKHLSCNQVENGICCKENVEIVSGQIVEKVEDMPFIARIHLKTGPFTSSYCGATIIANQILLTAKHCLVSFDFCIDELDCVAHFRDLVRGRDQHEKGQFYIPIVDIFERPGRSDLAVVKLKHGIEEHKDYPLGAKLASIKLAELPPKPGEVFKFMIIFNFLKRSRGVRLKVVQTGGWGLLGYNQGLSSELRSLNLTITTVPIYKPTTQKCMH